MVHFIPLVAVSLLTLSWGCATPTSPLVPGPGASASAIEHNEEGMKHYQMGHWEGAKEHFEAATEAEPK